MEVDPYPTNSLPELIDVDPPERNLMGEKGFENRASLFRGFGRRKSRRKSRFQCFSCETDREQAVVFEQVDGRETGLCQTCYIQFALAYEPDVPSYELSSDPEAR